MNIGGGDSLKLSGGCSGPGDGGKKAADGLVEGGEDLGGGGGGGGGGVGKCVIFEGEDKGGGEDGATGDSVVLERGEQSEEGMGLGVF